MPEVCAVQRQELGADLVPMPSLQGPLSQAKDPALSLTPYAVVSTPPTCSSRACCPALRGPCFVPCMLSVATCPAWAARRLVPGHQCCLWSVYCPQCCGGHGSAVKNKLVTPASHQLRHASMQELGGARLLDLGQTCRLHRIGQSW